ncbi:MFS transporter [Kribbella sp. NPDC056345]|uniref:MFS transporter n=1 Tax=Kribbella sp. NPDC056345 TaxID=3345789 RepID=UPI0035D7FC7B
MAITYRSADPVRTYRTYKTVWSFCAALCFTLTAVYYVREAGLSPLQLVLVGTTLELACFLFEIPTGIVADLYSRRLSVVIGVALIGCGFLLQGLSPTFLAILGAQVLWGVGYTFTSGADQAWLADEIGADQVAAVLVRTQQFGLGGTILGTICAGALGLLNLALPIMLSGLVMILLAVLLAVFMREVNFHRTPAGERETFKHMADTFKHGLAVARKRPVVRSLVLISLIAGLSSEAFDRLWQVKILGFQFPTVFGTSDPAFWFTVLGLVGTLLTLISSLILNKLSPERLTATHPNGVLALLALLQVIGVLAFALLGNLWLALAAMWLRSIADALSWPIESAWLNRNIESRSRATVISFVSQANAIGQVAGGPPLGALAGRAGLRTALVASGLLLAPIPVLFARLRTSTAELDRV